MSSHRSLLRERMENFQYNPVSPDVFQQQMMGSFCSLLNGQVLLAECFSEASESIKNSVADLAKIMEDTKREIRTEIAEMKTLLKQYLNSNGNNTVTDQHLGSNCTPTAPLVPPTLNCSIVPPIVQGMFDKLEAITSKLNKFKTGNSFERNDSGNGGDVTNSLSKQSSNNPIVSFLANPMPNLSPAQKSGGEIASKQTSESAARDKSLDEIANMMNNGIVIKTEVISADNESGKEDDRKESEDEDSSSSSASSSCSDDSSSSTVYEINHNNREGNRSVRCSPRKSVRGNRGRGKSRGSLNRYSTRTSARKNLSKEFVESASNDSDSNSTKNNTTGDQCSNHLSKRIKIA